MCSVFETLNAVNCNDKTEKKNGLTYLSWAWAWGFVKRHYPDANYTIYENQLPNGYLVNYFTDGKTCWVKTGVTIEGVEHIEELPVMDYKNKSISLEAITSFDVNKTIQRSLTKAAARHGLGLYIYAGEDLPEDASKIENTPNNEPSYASEVASTQPSEQPSEEEPEIPMITKEHMMTFLKWKPNIQEFMLGQCGINSVGKMTEPQFEQCVEFYTTRILPKQQAEAIKEAQARKAAENNQQEVKA